MLIILVMLITATVDKFAKLSIIFKFISCPKETNASIVLERRARERSLSYGRALCKKKKSKTNVSQITI